MCTLYERINNLCIEKGITNYKLCKDLGLQPSVLTDLKMGRQKKINADKASAIANYFGVTVSYLLGETDNPTEQPQAYMERNIDELLENASLPELLEIMSKTTERLNRLMGK